MNVREIFNFIEIDDRVATGGQPTEQQLRDARDAGYEVVVNLAPDGLETSLPDECALARSMGFQYHHIPVPWTNPQLDHLAAFTAVMDGISDRRVLVHCQANYRVTAFLSVYAMARWNWDAAQADALVGRIWNSRPDYAMDEAWRAFIDDAREQLPHRNTNGPP